MPPPLIGLTAARERAVHGVWDQEVAFLPRTYGEAVRRAGGIAALLPPDDAVAEQPDLVLDRVDGLILAGGLDIDPATYGARTAPETGRTDPERDRFELALAHRALERGVPLLGICRGMQMLNVASGGTLVQHLDRPAHLGTPGRFVRHEVRLVAGSLAARVAGEGRHSVCSHHHQGVDELGEGLLVTGWAADADEGVEAIEAPDRGFALGVLWHPEEDARDPVIPAFLEHVRTRADRGAPLPVAARGHGSGSDGEPRLATVRGHRN